MVINMAACAPKEEAPPPTEPTVLEMVTFLPVSVVEAKFSTLSFVERVKE